MQFFCADTICKVLGSISVLCETIHEHDHGPSFHGRGPPSNQQRQVNLYDFHERFHCLHLILFLTPFIIPLQVQREGQDFAIWDVKDKFHFDSL